MSCQSNFVGSWEMCPPGNAYNQPYVWADSACVLVHVTRSICEAAQMSFHPSTDLGIRCVCCPLLTCGAEDLLCLRHPSVQGAPALRSTRVQWHLLYLVAGQKLQDLHSFKSQKVWKVLSVWKRHTYIFPPAPCLWLNGEKWGAGFWCQGVNLVRGICSSCCCHISSPNSSRLTKPCSTKSSLLLFLFLPFCLPSKQE